MKEYILASASPRRKELLEQLGMEFDVYVSNADESRIRKNVMPPELYVEELALIKAAAVAKALEKKRDGIIISADTIVRYNDKILGKPINEQDAFDMLAMLSGNIHEVYTGICVMRLSDGFSVSDYERTAVCFNELSQDMILRYIKTGEPMDKAGAYAIQGRGAVFVRRIEGDYSNVVGLPLANLAHILKKDFDKEII